MKEEWIKAASAMGGMVHYGAVDCTQEQELASQFGIQGSFDRISTVLLIRRFPYDQDLQPHQQAAYGLPECP